MLFRSGQAKAAEAFGHKFPTTVQAWQSKGRIPAWRLLEIERAAQASGVNVDDELAVLRKHMGVKAPGEAA